MTVALPFIPSPKLQAAVDSADEIGGTLGVLLLSTYFLEDRNPAEFEGICPFVAEIESRDTVGKKETLPERYISALYAIDIYIGQIYNGGHGQYIENSKLSGIATELCQEGLEAIGATEYLALYNRMLDIMDLPEQQINLSDGAFGATPEIGELDDEFYNIQNSRGHIYNYVKDYLVQQPWFFIIDGDYRAALDWLWHQIHRDRG